MYWGEPIPLVYCEKCGWVPVPESELPLMRAVYGRLSSDRDGESPLARATDWVNTTCPNVVRQRDVKRILCRNGRDRRGII